MVCFYETQTNISISEILLRNIDEKITITVEKVHQFSFSSFFRIWTYGLQTLVMKVYLGPEDGNEYYKNAGVVIIDGTTGGHIPKNLSKTFKRFLILPNCAIKCTVIRKRMNHGAGYELKISVNFKFLGQAKAIP